MLLVPGAFRRNLNRRKKLAVMLMLLVIVPLVSLLIACGGGGVNNSGTTSGGGTTGTSAPGTPLGTSQVTVSSTAGASNQHDVSISITITQ
jgi:hypothetical protein